MQKQSFSGEDGQHINKSAHVFTNREKLLVFSVVLVCIIACVVSFWLQKNYTLGYTVYYNGEQMCDVLSKEEFPAAKKIFCNMFVNDSPEQTKEILSENFVFKNALIRKKSVKNANEICDCLAEYYKNEISYACGMYIDGKFLAAVSNKSVIDAVLEEIIEREVSLLKGESGEIYESIKTVNGYYDNGSIIEDSRFLPLVTNQNIKTLESQDLGYIGTSQASPKEELEHSQSAENCLLHVAVKLKQSYEDNIPYETIYTYDDAHYSDYYVVDKAGAFGHGVYTDEVVYFQGEEISRANLSVKVLQEPEKEHVTMGSVQRSSGYEPGVASGIFHWPTPSLWQITSYWGDGRAHKGFDISGYGSHGAPIVASDAGVVELSTCGWNGGYGNCVVINHGNGTKTRYAHCSSLNVSAGEVVAKGDVIAWVGNTGASQGAHLHFEILINTIQVDPYPYLVGGISIDRM